MSFYSDIYAANGAPVLALSQFFLGKTPGSASEFSNLTGFIASQEAFGSGLKVGDSDLFGYQSLSKTLGESTQGQAKLKGGTDTEFVARVYKEIFGSDPSAAQTKHFVSQIAYFQDLYESDPNTSQTTLDFGARGAVVGQIMGAGILAGTTPYAQGVFDVFQAARATGTIEFGKPLADYAPAPVTPPAPPTGGGGSTPAPTPKDTIVKVVDGTLAASSTKGDGTIQAGLGIPSEGFQITTNQTKGIEVGLAVYQRGVPGMYESASVATDGTVVIEAPAGSDPTNANRAFHAVAFSANTGIHDVLTGPYQTKFYADKDPTDAIDFAVFDIYKDSKVTSPNVAQDIWNTAFLPDGAAIASPTEGSIFNYKIETTDMLGNVLASQSIVVHIVAPVVPEPVL